MERIPTPEALSSAGPEERVNAPSRDSEAIARCLQGEESAYEVLYSRHKRQVYFICLRMLRQKEDAEDLTQETFIQVFRKLSSFRGESSFSTWLHRVTIRVVLMHLRRKRPIPVSLESEKGENNPNHIRTEDEVQDRNLTGTVDRIDLERATAELPAGYRTIFWLHDVQGHNHAEIASILDCSLGNSKSQLHKAHVKLRALLRARKRRQRSIGGPQPFPKPHPAVATCA